MWEQVNEVSSPSQVNSTRAKPVPWRRLTLPITAHAIFLAPDLQGSRPSLRTSYWLMIACACVYI